MDSKPKKRSSFLKPRPETESTPVKKTTKRISFSAKTNVKEFRDGECGTEWNESYELSANCQTASDQGDTHATVTMTDMTSHTTTNLTSHLVNHENKENIDFIPSLDGNTSVSTSLRYSILERANNTLYAIETEEISVQTPIRRRPGDVVADQVSQDEMELTQIQENDASIDKNKRRTVILNEDMKVDEVTKTEKRLTVHQPTEMELELEPENYSVSNKLLKPRRSPRLQETDQFKKPTVPKQKLDAPKKVTVKLLDSKTTTKKVTSENMKTRRGTTYEGLMELDTTKNSSAEKVRATIYDTPIMLDGPRIADVQVVDCNKRKTVHEASMVIENDMSSFPVTSTVMKSRETIHEASMMIESPKSVPVEKIETNPSVNTPDVTMVIESTSSPTPLTPTVTVPAASKRATVFEAPMSIESVEKTTTKIQKASRKAFAEVTVLSNDMSLDEPSQPVELPIKTTRRGTVFSAQMELETEKVQPKIPSKIPTPQKRKTALGGVMDLTSPTIETPVKPPLFQSKQSLTPSKIPKLIPSPARKLITSPARKKRLTTVGPLNMDLSSPAVTKQLIQHQALTSVSDMELSMIECKSRSPSFNLGHQARSTMYDLPIHIDDGSSSPTPQVSEVSSLDLMGKSFINKQQKPGLLQAKTIFSFKRPFAMIESPKVKFLPDNLSETKTSSGSYTSARKLSEGAMERCEAQRKSLYEDDMNVTGDIIEKLTAPTPAPAEESSFNEKIDSMQLSLDIESPKVIVNHVNSSTEPKIRRKSVYETAEMDVTVPVNLDNHPIVESKKTEKCATQPNNMKVTLIQQVEAPKQELPVRVTDSRRTIVFPKDTEMEISTASIINDVPCDPDPESELDLTQEVEKRGVGEAWETIDDLRDAAVFKRPSSLGFELTKAAVNGQELLDKTTLNLVERNISSLESTLYHVTSVGNLTFGNLSDHSNSNTSLNALDQVKSSINVSNLIDSIKISPEKEKVATPDQSSVNDTCSCSINVSVADVTVGRTRRSSLANPEYERIRQQMLNNQPVFIYCKNCKCTENSMSFDTESDLEKEVEQLLGLDKLTLIEPPKSSLDELLRENDKQIAELKNPSFEEVVLPANPGLKFLLENVMKQSEDERDKRIENFKDYTEFAHIPAPYPMTRDYAFLIKNKIETENIPWMVRRSIHSPIGIMQYCHKRLQSVLLHVEISKDSLKGDQSRPFSYREAEIIVNRLRPPATPYAFALVEEFKKQLPIGSSLLYCCATSNDQFSLFNYLDEVICGCENRMQRLFSILNENNTFPYISGNQLFAKKQMIFDDHKVILMIHLKLSDVENFSADCVVTNPRTAIPEKLKELNVIGVPLLEYLLVNVNSILFS